ncbi:hypothetical protein MLD38_001074 [Melastoma candidum]|uniref:Uncharacterized protein n=1 Tax=Melastoma candidum TaxID=119954 RepID=A0ACB9SH05_9MYRT|nr:hypothetical protein MLD38_001074 [Melastoma candidum]
MSKEEEMRSPQGRNSLRVQAGGTETVGNEEALFSPGFRSVAVMAGWDEETLLIASLIVDDTPDRQFKQRRRTDSGLKTPPSSSRSGKRRRDMRRIPNDVPAIVLELSEDQAERKPDSHDMKEKTGPSNKVVEEHKGVVESKAASSASTLQSQGLPLPSMDRLREELSCAICLEICFEPSTTPCGHSFCRKCLKSAADKCGKRCPKCRQIISNGRSCSVNTVLWNTIQLLFPHEVESRKAAKAEKIVATEEPECNLPEMAASNSNRRRSLRAAAIIGRELYERRATPSIHEVPQFHVPERGEITNYRRRSRRSVGVPDRDLHERRRPIPSQDEDAALALRLQREEFMEAFRETRENSRTSTSLSTARANLRALASRAINIRVRNQTT